jgi:hypothetical protein
LQDPPRSCPRFPASSVGLASRKETVAISRSAGTDASLEGSKTEP